MKVVDINCDVGEGINNEEVLLLYISSCNIACGGHAGNKETIDHVIKLALENQVKIGAHPAFPDRNNFGRVIMDLSMNDLADSLIAQIHLIQTRLQLVTDATLHHVKAHGALYNLSAHDADVAKVLIDVVKQTAPNAFLYVPCQSVLAEMASQCQLAIKYEAFADRNYTDALTLVPRSQPNAVITDTDDVLVHLLRMIQDQEVQTLSGNTHPIKADTYCIHGDNPSAVDLVKLISTNLHQQGITIA